ncbi:hypothetical protein B0H19DRAFT_1373283 [Mycena capillaripes]|nr:hypothetical protein B0H19DRAFT_1373283 [Mycena capillaripes]
MKKSKSKEVERVQDDIEQIVENLDPAVRARWFGYKPTSSSSRKDQYSPLSSPNKPSTSKTPKRKKPAVDENDIDIVLDSDPDIEFVPHPQKKQRCTSPEIEDDNNDDSVEMSCYLYVETPPPAILHVRKGPSKPLAPKTTELGPFLFNSSIKYPDFLRILADGCPKKSLANTTAYDVMVKSLKDRKKDYVFSVYMAPPTAVKRELPWIESNNGGSTLDFGYNLEEATSNSVKSIRDQISTIDASSNTELNELLEKYPIDNNPLFPGKRIFHNETGYFDLSDIKLRVWAVAKANGTATIEKPPASNHFFKNQTIQPPRASGLPAPAPSAQAVDNASPNLLQLLLGQPHLLQQMINPFHQPLPNPYASYMQYPSLPHPPFGLPLPHPQAPQAVESPPVELPRDISLEEYFERYKLNPDDRRILIELGYVPGHDGIKDLDAATWEVTKVAPLAKARILRQHGTFLKDVEKGLWN